jgi:hypothetical protein
VSRSPLRRVAACSATGVLVVAILCFVSGIAAADDTTPTTDPSTPTSTTVPDANTAPSTDPPTTPADPGTTPSTDTADPTAEPSTDPSTDVPTVGQDTTVDNTQTGVANSGTNTAVGDSPGSTSPVTDPGGSSSASVASGDATSVGGGTQDAISQQATAVATQAAHIVITQLALIVNIGLALSNSGADTAAATNDPPGAGVSLVGTGNASVTGLTGSTAVTQVVHLLDTSEHTDQTAAVTNVGVGVGNTGANVATGAMSAVEPDGTAVAVSWGPSDSSSDSSSVRTGSATAVGDLSHTTIVQVAMGSASDDGTLTITQRAVVVNFGAALANSGFDTASASGGDDAALLVRGIVLALLAMLQPSAPTATVSSSSASTLASGSTAAVSTGNALAVGNASSTGIRQLAAGSVSGDHHATADQTATVGNFGFALANTGVNTAGGPLPVDEAAQLASIPDAFAGFLNLLADPDAQAIWSTDMQIGAELLAASASVTAVESLFDLPASTPDSVAQVVVHQITGILNLMIGVAVSGKNDASDVVETGGTAHGANVHGTSALQQTSTAGGSAVVHTGDADVTNRQTTTVCQVIEVSASACLPPSPPVPPTVPVEPASVTPLAAAAAVAPTPAAQLAFTGGHGTEPELATGLVAVLAGLLLVVAARRRRLARR